MDAAADVEDAALWGGLHAHVRSTLGIVGISKMLAAPSDAAAAVQWLARVRPIIERLEPLGAVHEGSARIRLRDGVAVQFDIHDVVVIVDGQPRVQTMILFDPAAVAVLMVGQRRWGDEWIGTVQEHPSDRPVVAAEGWSDNPDFSWVAQNPGTPGPWTTTASEQDAHLAATAEDLGFERMWAMYRDFEEAARSSARAHLGAAIAAYVGRRVRRIPTADESAVFALDPARFAELMPMVRTALAVSDSIRLDGVDRNDVRARLVARLREELPDLDETGIDALAWRWAFLAFHG